MATTMAQPKVCCVIGAGDGTASAVARRFAGEGYTVCLARRTVAALQPLVDRITNAGGHVRAYALDARRGDQVVGFFDRIEAEVGAVDAVVGFLAGREAALRALAQAMARVLGPKGLHVAHVVIDGLIDIAFSREHFAQRVIEAESDGILNSDHVADAFWWLHNQPRDAWTFELDLRPAAERW
jgi:NADP-dependent 3-hydroxy acid dehydrogenase YdfG